MSTTTRRKPINASALSVDELRKRGYTAEVVERYNAHTRRRHDLFGFIDILAIHPEHGFLAIQATSGQHGASHVHKIMDPDRAKTDKERAAAEKRVAAAETWLAAGGKLEIWAWRRVQEKTSRGKEVTRYRYTSYVFELE